MRNSECFKVCRGYKNNFDTKSQNGYHTSSVISFTESTAASTMFNHKKESLEDFEENIWAEKKDNKRYKETFIGEEAFLNYYKRYRQVSQDPERYKASPSVEFIKETSRLKVPPAPFGLVKRKGKPGEINVKHYNIGNSYGKAIGKTIRHVKPKALILG